MVMWPAVVRRVAVLLAIMKRAPIWLRTVVLNRPTTPPMVPPVRRSVQTRCPSTPGIARTSWSVGTLLAPRW